uniref:Reverse transcriptase domain-containing protein n=1 Tax=Mesocestoides corti TaxID=53468 RepID=A0A5K3FHS0_MESCO
MSGKGFRSDMQLNERIAAIRENNDRIESRHREIELDKKRAADTGSLILPSQIRVTITRSEARSNHSGFYDNGRPKGKQRKPDFQIRGGDLRNNLSKSLSRLHQDSTYNYQPQFSGNRSKCSGVASGGHAREADGFSTEYFRFVEIDHQVGRKKPQRQQRNQNNRTKFGYHPNQRYGNDSSQHPSNQSQPTLSSAKSLPSLDPTALRPSSHYSQQASQNHSCASRPRQPLPPRFRNLANRNRAQMAQRPDDPVCCCAQSVGGQLRGRRKAHSPTAGERQSSVMWPPPPPPKDKSGHWIRGRVIRSEAHKTSERPQVAAVGTQSDDLPEAPSTSHRNIGSPFVNDLDDVDNDDDDGYIDDNPLDDLDQFTLKIDMDGGFIVHDATICDPILSKPISSWIDEEDSPEPQQPPPTAETRVRRNSTKDVSASLPLDVECCIFSNSSLTTSGVSTLSSLDCRLLDDGVTAPIQRSLSADQLDKASRIIGAASKPLCFRSSRPIAADRNL